MIICKCYEQASRMIAFRIVKQCKIIFILTLYFFNVLEIIKAQIIKFLNIRIVELKNFEW